MNSLSRFRWLPVLALTLTACSDGPVAPAEDLGLPGDAPLAAVMPDLAPEPGTAGTERYVPVLERILMRSIRVVREKHGEEAAGKVVAEARTLREAVRAAHEAQDTAALKAAVQKLEGFSAQIGLRVFGVSLVRHVHQDAAGKLEALTARLKAASDAGQDVGRWAAGARMVRQHLAAARDAAGMGRPVVALVQAAQALDLVTRITAAF
jgi:hypothetical protein